MTTKKYVKSILKKFHQQSYRSLTVHRLRPKRQDERLSITDERHSITKSDLKNIKIENNHCKNNSNVGGKMKSDVLKRALTVCITGKDHISVPNRTLPRYNYILKFEYKAIAHIWDKKIRGRKPRNRNLVVLGCAC